MAHTMNLTGIKEAIVAHLEQQSQWKQENLRFAEQLQQQRLRMVEELDRLYERMTIRMLELLREGVDEEEKVSNGECFDENQPLAEAFQVFDEMPSAVEEVVPPRDCYQQPPAHDVTHGGSVILANPSKKGMGTVAQQCWPFQALEPCGCKGGYEGIKVIGQCYEMLLTLSVPRMEGDCASPLLCSPAAGNRMMSFNEFPCFEKMEHSYFVDRAHGCGLPVFDPGILGAVLENWLAEDKLEGSEELGDLAKTVDKNLALKIYIKARATPRVVAVFAERKQFDKILIYSKQVGCTPDYLFLLQTILGMDPGLQIFVCDVCEKTPATVICCADEAALCAKCDHCQGKTAFIFCVEDRSLFCQDCGESIRSASTLAANHQRHLATGIRVALGSLSKGRHEPEKNSKKPCNQSAQQITLQTVQHPHSFSPSNNDIQYKYKPTKVGSSIPYKKARCWYYETGVALGIELDGKMLQHEYDEYLGPDYTLRVALSNMENKNSKPMLDVKLMTDSHCAQSVFDLISFPGKMPGAATLRDYKVLKDMVEKQAADGDLCGAICAVPAVALGDKRCDVLLAHSRVMDREKEEKINEKDGRFEDIEKRVVVALTQVEELRRENEFLQEDKAVSDADLKQLLKIMGEKGEKNDAHCEEMRKITREKDELHYNRLWRWNGHLIQYTVVGDDFISSEGKKLFIEAAMEGFYKLIFHFQTQSKQGPWRWFDESMLDCCEPLETVKAKGISAGKIACLAHCAGAVVQTFRTNESSTNEFRNYVKACPQVEDVHVVSSYHRGIFKQTGSGHFSPIGGYHVGRDMTLILDVARFKYPPHWVLLTLLWEAMDTIDEASGENRGYMLISRQEQEAALLFTLSCQHQSWGSVAKYLIEDIPSLLKSTSMKDVEEAISVVCISLPSNFRNFIKWAAEVRRTEDNGESLSKDEITRLRLKEELLKQVQETGLYNYVTKFLSSAYTCARKDAKLGHEETLSDVAAADVHNIYKLEAVRVVFAPGGRKLVAVHIQSWMHSTPAAVPRRSDRILARKMVQRRHVVAVLYLALRVGLNEDQACWELLKSCRQLSLSLEDKALKGGALMQDFPIYTHFQLIFHFCLNISVLISLLW